MTVTKKLDYFPRFRWGRLITLLAMKIEDFRQ